MPLKNGGFWEEKFFEGLAALPLPGAAVVIDVREESNGGNQPPLIEYLAREIEELAVEMRLNAVARWRLLADCIEFLRIESVSPDVSEQEDTIDFILTTRSGKQKTIQGRDDLTMTIGRGYIDRVRNQHIAAIRDNGPDEEKLSEPGIDPEQPTVRIIFLTDAEDRQSLIRAKTYAGWLKEWIDLQHGRRRYSRDERIGIVAICLNTPTTGQRAIIRLLGGMPSQDMEAELDSIILIQSYRDDGAFIGGDSQVAQAELVLYTLLLHWPQIMTPEGQGLWYASDVNERYDTDSDMLCPTYVVGIAAQEYSARWGARWLDYGLTARALELMRDVKHVDQELKTLRPAVRDWFDGWWANVKGIIPIALYGTVSDIHGLEHLQQLVRRSPFRSGSQRQAPEELRRFSDEVRSLYASSGSGTLERVIESAPFLLEQMRKNGNDPTGVAMEARETSTQLTGLYIKAQRFTDDLFRGAWGAVPRAGQQIAILRDCANDLRTIQNNPPNIETMRAQIERETKEADELLRYKIYALKLPFIGEVLPSTIISVLLALVLLAALWTGSGNMSFVPGGFRQPLVAGITGIQMCCVLLVAALEAGFLLLRNARIKQEQQAIYRKLRDTMSSHLAQISAFVAANAALVLLEWAMLYKPDQESSQYEERLKQLDRALADAQAAAQHHYTTADQRLRLSLKQRPLKNALEPPWPNMSNRKDYLTWKQLQSAHLSARDILEKGFPPLEFLSEMLIRRMGTENTEAILQSMFPAAALGSRSSARQTPLRSLTETSKKQPLYKTDDEIRFQLLSTMLVGVLFSSDIVPLAVQDIVPLIERYSQQKRNYMTEPSVLASEVLDLNELARETMLEQAQRGDTAVTNFTLRPYISAEFVLAAWMKQQNLFDVTLAESLEENDVIAILNGRKVRLDQALDDLRRTSRLTGYPDDASGEDHFLVLLAPGVTSEAFSTNEEANGDRPVHYPDAEKIVYLHIHRLRRLLPGAPLLLK